MKIKDLMINYKWHINWAFLILMALVCIASPILIDHFKLFEGRESLQLATQTLVSFLGIYAALLIFFSSKLEADKSNTNLLSLMKDQHKRHLQVVMADSDNRISEFQKSTKSQTDRVVEAIKNQSEVMFNLSEHLKNEKRSSWNVGYEICRLDLQIDHNREKLIIAERILEDVSEFKFFRFVSRRISEIKEQKAIIAKIEKELKKLIDRRNGLAT